MQKQHQTILKLSLKKKIQQLFQQIIGPKVIYIDQDISNLFNFAYSYKFKQLISQQSKIIQFQEDSEAIDSHKHQNLFFIIHPKASAMTTIKSIIQRNKAKNIIKKYIVCFIPFVDVICTQIMQELQIKNSVIIKNFNFGLIPFHDGLLSLQLSSYVHNVDIINCCTQAIIRLSNFAGQFQRIIGKGQTAQLILKNLQKKSKQIQSSTMSRDDTLLIVIDRKIDLITPMLTSQTYQALLDQFFGISCNSIKIKKKLLGGIGDELQAYRLYNTDKIYDQIAYMTLSEAKQHLKKRKSEVKQILAYKSKSAVNVKQIQQVQQVWGVKYTQISNHINLVIQIINKLDSFYFSNLVKHEANLITEFKTDLQDLQYLTLQQSSQKILKIICLYSQVYPLTSFYSKFQKQILEIMIPNYSSQQLYSLYLLQKIGLLKNSKIKNRWQQIRNTFQLLPINQHSYTKVYFSYSALSVRFIQLIVKNLMTQQMSMLLGQNNNYKKGGDKDYKKIKQLYVFYVGGITYGQISCLKYLQLQLKIKITVITTNILSGNDLISKSIKINQI